MIINPIPTDMRMLTDTGYPVSLADVAREYRDVFGIIEACGGNIDAPCFILSGEMFCGYLSKMVLPGIAYIR